jgi:4-hydroxybenzoate polyprenyltransferase
MQFIAFIWQSRIWIACCAVAFYISQSLAYGIEWTAIPEYSVILVVATWCLYSWHYLEYTTQKFQKNYSQFLLKMYLTLLMATSIAVSISIIYWGYFWHFLFPGIVALIYIAFNLLQNKKVKDIMPSKLVAPIQFLLIKRNKWIKPLSIAFVWAAITTPPHIAYTSYDFVIFGSHMMLIFAIALFFDLKDIKRDQGEGIHTLAATWGPSTTKWVVSVIIFLANTLYYLHDPSLYWLVVYLLTTLVIWQYPVSRLSQEFYFYFVVDGLIFFPWLVQ